MAITVITIQNINQAKAPHHSFLPVIAASTQEQALEELAHRFPWYNTSGGWGYWLEQRDGGSLFVPADWQRKTP